MKTIKTLFNSKIIFFLVLFVLLLHTACKEKDSSTTIVTQRGCALPLFSFSREFPMDINAKLEFGKELGGGSTMVKGSGVMAFDFEPTTNPEILLMRLRDMEINLASFDFQLTKDEKIKIDGIKLNSQNFDLQTFEGTLNTVTKDVSLKFTIILYPNQFPILEKFKVFAPIRLVANEKGRMDIKTREFETHAEGFSLGSGVLKFATIYGGQFGCGPPEMEFCVTTDVIPDKRGCPKEVWICPGEKAILYYQVSSNADPASITISPNVGNVNFNGQVEVSPLSDTEYVLFARKNNDNDCTAEERVTVRVVESGDRRLLSATPDFTRCLWSLTIPAETTSPNIEVTSIKTVECGFGYGVISHWFCTKTNVDGFVYQFDIFDYPTSPGVIPLVGTWQFVPDVIDCRPQNNACFEVTLRCK